MDNKGLSGVGFFAGIAWLTLIIFAGVFVIGALIKYEMVIWKMHMVKMRM